MCQTRRQHRRWCFSAAPSAGERTRRLAACTAAQCCATASALLRPPNWKPSRRRAASRLGRSRARICLRRFVGRSAAPRHHFQVIFHLWRTAHGGRHWQRRIAILAQRRAQRSAGTVLGEGVGELNPSPVHYGSRIFVCSASQSARAWARGTTRAPPTSRTVPQYLSEERCGACTIPCTCKDSISASGNPIAGLNFNQGSLSTKIGEPSRGHRSV
jgi:hypothetical protein